nr:MAG TPA: hypothetical protein [Caudoviricetes sp.]
MYILGSLSARSHKIPQACSGKGLTSPRRWRCRDSKRDNEQRTLGVAAILVSNAEKQWRGTGHRGCV